MGRSSRSRTLTAVLAAVALVGLHEVTARAKAPVVTPPGPVGELVSGTSRYVDGTFTATDFAYDDRGPDTNVRPGGDATYPAGMTPNNVADLIQVQVRADGEAIGVTVLLETLTPSTSPLVGVAFDSENDAATGAAALPGSWRPAAGLGVDRLAVLANGAGRALTYADGRWSDAGTFGVAADIVANALTATLPFELPPAGTLRTVAVAGYEHDGASWLNGRAPVHDLAFVPGEDPTTPYLQGVADAIVNFVAGGDPLWQDYRQSAILAGAADPAPAVAAIDVAALRSRHTDAAPALAKGFHTFLYRSALDLGEGIQGSGNAALFAGPYQPYLVWAPGGATAGLPLVLYLHGSSQTHLSPVNTAPYSRESQDPVLGVPDTFFDHFRAVVAWPLGRGPQQWYEGASEQDVLDVHADVVRRLALDGDRSMLAGLSMGGMGTFRLAELYPDRWSIAYSDVGYDTSVKLPENLTALPVRFQNGAADYLVHVHNALATRDLLEAAATVDYRSYILHQRHHQPAVALAECIYERSFGLARVRNPARVRYTIDPSMFDVDERTGLHLVYDGAYWIDGMTSAGGRASVDLVSEAMGTLPRPEPTTRTIEQNLTGGRDFCGPNEDVDTRDTWDEQGKVVTNEPAPVVRRVTGTLTNLEKVTLAADRAGVATGTLRLTTDRAVALKLTGLARRTVVTAGDATVVARRDGVVTIRLAAGTNDVTVGGSRRSA